MHTHADHSTKQGSTDPKADFRYPHDESQTSLPAFEMNDLLWNHNEP